MEFNGAFIQLSREKKTSMHFETSLMSLESTMNFTKKITSVVSLMVCTMFNNPIGVKNSIYWTYK